MSFIQTPSTNELLCTIYHRMIEKVIAFNTSYSTTHGQSTTMMTVRLAVSGHKLKDTIELIGSYQHTSSKARTNTRTDTVNWSTRKGNGPFDWQENTILNLHQLTDIVDFEIIKVAYRYRYWTSENQTPAVVEWYQKVDRKRWDKVKETLGYKKK